MPPDISQSKREIRERIEAINTYKESSEESKNIFDKAGDSLTQVGDFLSSQVDQLEELQKRFMRNTQNSLDSLVDFITLTKGSGSETFRFVRDKMLEAVVAVKPKVAQIVSEEALKAVGCSQDQTYTAIPKTSIQIENIDTLPVSEGIYIPVKSIDIGSNLKRNPLSLLGEVYYEKPNPSTDTQFIPYGGEEYYPFNKMLYYRMTSQNENRTYSKEFGKFYYGSSQEPLFDLSYTTKNDLGIEGDYFRVLLLDRDNVPTNLDGVKLNNVNQFLKDYYSTINIADEVDFVAQLTNVIVNSVNIKAQIGFDEAQQKTKLLLLLQRILGLCFDERREIDVSGISKIGELDGVDESFFEFTEVDLRFIDQTASNIRKGIVQFAECDNIELPVNADQIVDELVKFRNEISGQTNSQVVQSMNKILDSITENPQWKLLIPNNVGIGLAVDRDIIKKIPLALASTILTPKVLFPIFTMLSVVEINAKNKVNNYINSANTFVDSANTFLQSGTTIGENVNNIINDQVDFVKKFRSFVIEVTSRLNAEFLRVLFEILKREIFFLLESVIKDIEKEGTKKTYAMILRLVQISYLIVRGIADYRKCKSLLDEITLLLSALNGYGLKNIIPSPLLLLSKYLPGYSWIRAKINVIQELQRNGVPTGPLPDGSANVMNQFIESVIRGIDAEKIANGKVQVTVNPDNPTEFWGKDY